MPRRSFMIQRCLLALLLCSSLLCFADDKPQDWLPVTPQDLQMKEVPGDPGASAIQLYYADFIDHKKKNESLYYRIKVLNNKGLKYANVEIDSGESWGVKDLKDLQARTIHPDGSIVPFSGTPFEKTVFKGKGIKLTELTFTLPEVTVGSIIEYKYRIEWKHQGGSDYWILQHDLFTVKEEFNLRAEPPSPQHQVKWVRLATEANPTPADKENTSLKLENIPAFIPEEYMPPEYNYKPSIRFFYLPQHYTYPDVFWNEMSRGFSYFFEDFAGNSKETKAEAQRVIGSETNSEKQLKLLYARAQQVRNLSYERRLSRQEEKREDIKENKHASEVLSRGYGNRNEINILFVALARAVGFNAAMVMVSSRRSRFFNQEVLSLGQFDSFFADVIVNGQHTYLDPGTRFCPYGLLRWMQTSTKGLRPSTWGANFVDIPPFGQEKAVIRRNATMAVAEDGSVKGSLVLQFEGIEALEHRLEAMDNDDAGTKKDLEEEVKAWLPSNAVVKLKDVHGLTGTDEPLIASFDLEVPSFASFAGKRHLLPSYLFLPKRKDAFNHETRKYPLYFPFAFSELDTISFKLPAGFTAESVPAKDDALLPYARYHNTSQLADGQLVTTRTLLFNGIFFETDKFPNLKAFFSKVQALDEQQAVFQQGSATAEKNPGRN